MSMTAAAFLFCFAAGLGLALFRHPIFGLYTYVAVFYLDAPSRWWGQGLPDLRWSLLTAVVTAAAMLRHKPDPDRTPWHKTFPAVFLIGYTAWLWIQSPWALDPDMHRKCAILFTKFIIVYFMVYRLVDTPLLTADFLLAHVLGAFYLGVLALDAGLYQGRLDGVGGAGIDDSNTLGMHAAAIAIAGAMLIFAQRDWRRYAAICAMPFILNMVVLTGSRGAFLALLTGGMMIFWLRPRENPRLFYTFVALGVLGFGYVASETFWQRMGTIQSAARQDENIDNSAEGRIEQFKAGLVMFRSHPLGVGHRGFVTLSPAYLDQKYLTDGGRSSHNTPLTTLVEQGIPGAAMYLLLIMWIARSCIIARGWAKARRPLLGVCMATAVCSGLIVALVGGLFADFLKAEVIIWLLALLASLRSAAAPRRSERKAHARQPTGQLASIARP